MIAALLWKDVRLTVPVYLFAVCVISTSFLGVFGLAYAMAPGHFPWAEAILTAVHFSQWLLLPVCAVLGGNAFACEREDRSCEFLMALAVAPRHVLFSKSIITVLTFECLWIACAAVFCAALPFAAIGFDATLPGAASMSTIAAASLLVLGLSWFWSSLMNKPVAAAGTGLLTTGLLYMVLYGVASAVTGQNVSIADLAPAAALLGFAASIAGGVVFLRSRGVAFAAPPHTTPLPVEIAMPTSNPATCGAARVSSCPTFALLWKDWRLIRNVLGVGLLIAGIPYLAAMLLALGSRPALELFARASTQSLWLSSFIVAVWAGYSISTERRSGSERYLNALPVARMRIAASTLSVAVLPSLFAAGTNILLATVLHAHIFYPTPFSEGSPSFRIMTWDELLWQQSSLLFALPALGSPMVCFGVAWWASARWKMPFAGMAAGIASALVSLLVWVAFSNHVRDVLLPVQTACVYAAANGAAGAVCVALGFRRLTTRDTT